MARKWVMDMSWMTHNTLRGNRSQGNRSLIIQAGVRVPLHYIHSVCVWVSPSADSAHTVCRRSVVLGWSNTISWQIVKFWWFCAVSFIWFSMICFSTSDCFMGGASLYLLLIIVHLINNCQMDVTLADYSIGVDEPILL